MLNHPRRPLALPLAAVLLAGCAAGSGPAPSEAPSIATSPDASAVGSAPSGTASATGDGHYKGAAAVIDVAAGPRGVAFASGAIWVASTIGGSIQRVDPATNSVVATIDEPKPVTLVTLGGQLWASVLHDLVESHEEVVRIDGATNRVAQRVAIPVFHNIATGGGRIWAVDDAGTLRSVDPANGRVTTAGSVGILTEAIAANDSAVFGASGGTGGVAWRYDMRTAAITTQALGVAVPGRSRVSIAPGAGARLWVAVPGAVVVLDPGSLSIDARIDLPTMQLVNDLWATSTDIWLSANVVDPSQGLSGGVVLRIDPATTKVTAAYPLGPESSGVVDAVGSLWAVDQADNKLARFTIAGG